MPVLLIMCVYYIMIIKSYKYIIHNMYAYYCIIFMVKFCYVELEQDLGLNDSRWNWN